MTHAPWHSRPSGGGIFSGAHPSFTGSYSPPPQQAFSPQDMNIQPAPSPITPPFSPQDMNIQPALPPPTFISPQDMNIQPAPSPITPPFSPQDMNIQPALPPPTFISPQDMGIKPALPLVIPPEGDGDGDGEVSEKPDPKDKGAKKPVDLLKIFNEKGKKGLTETQLVRIVHLLAANKRNKNVLSEEEEEAFSGLFGENYAKDLEERIQGYREGYPDYFADAEGFTPAMKGLTGLWNSLTAGKVRPDGSLTLSGIRDTLSTSDEAWLKINRPDLYYGGRTDVTTMPGIGGAQTTGGLEDLASLPISGPNAVTDPELIRRIVDARQTLGTEKLRQEQAGQGGAGIADLATPIPDPFGIGAGETVTAPSTTTVPGAATLAATTTTPTPFDYSQWPQFTSAYPGYNQYPGPNYINQGLGRWPQFDYWNQIANTFPGMSQYG